MALSDTGRLEFRQRFLKHGDWRTESAIVMVAVLRHNCSFTDRISAEILKANAVTEPARTLTPERHLVVMITGTLHSTDKLGLISSSLGSCSIPSSPTSGVIHRSPQSLALIHYCGWNCTIGSNGTC